MSVITVKGMSCGHCVAVVKKALEAIPGVSQVQIDLGSGRVAFDAATPIPIDELARVIRKAGYDLAEY